MVLSKSPFFLIVAATVWIAAVIAGWCTLSRHELTPGVSADAPQIWPLATDLVRDPTRPTLVVFVHPRCPCTVATLHELDRIAARCEQKLHIVVSMLSTPEIDAPGESSDIYVQAISIPGVDVRADPLGASAACFAAQTSGQCLLYGADGRLGFSGGITASRGHEGDSAGADAIVDLVSGRHAACSSTPVFGCGLRRAEPNAGEARP